jgi:diguanylate cyclase (GGDEF)-like protein/PAS domain S-box-containing protein
MPRAERRRARGGDDGSRRDGGALTVAESEAQHRALLCALPDGVILQDNEGGILLANPRARYLLGLGRDDVSSPPAADVTSRRAQDDRHPARSEDDRHPARSDSSSAIPAPRRPDPGTDPDADPDSNHDPAARLTVATSVALRTGQTQRDVTVPIERDGGTRTLSVTSIPLLGDDGSPHAVVSVLSDRDAPPLAAAAGRRAEDLFRQGMQHSPIGVAVAALNGRFLKVNRMLCRMLGYRADELQERALYEIVHPDDVEDTSVQIGHLLRGDVDAVTLERRYVGHGDMTLWGMLSVTLVRDGQGRPLQFVVQIEDVSDVHRAQELLSHMTLHDPLTGLANRTLVLDRIQKALDRSRRHDRKVAVLQCDVDHFKVINDSAGHERGDTVLVEVGRRVTRALRAGDTAARPGGDEFVVVCEDVADEREAVAIAERLQRSVNVPLAVGERTLLPTVSVGIAVSATPDADPLSLLRDADIATYRAKERGRNRWDLVDGALRRSALDRLDIEHALRAGISAGELRLHFQPIVDLDSLEVVGREALVRWYHPERGLLGPATFLPMAEESGLILEIGAWVLAEAAQTASAWMARQGTGGYVAVNVSPHQVNRPGLADSVEKSLAEAGLPAQRLVIELTESVMLSAAPGARREIERLDQLGVRIVVDDFGTGFCALSYLRDLPVSGIKVDRSFTAGLGNDPHCERIVEALTGLGHGLGVDVIVEGVETEQQREMLASIGAEHAQGYLFGRPSPVFG